MSDGVCILCGASLDSQEMKVTQYGDNRAHQECAKNAGLIARNHVLEFVSRLRGRQAFLWMSPWTVESGIMDTQTIDGVHRMLDDLYWRLYDELHHRPARLEMVQLCLQVMSQVVLLRELPSTESVDNLLLRYEQQGPDGTMMLQ